jgi:flagellar assembly factor FliW
MAVKPLETPEEPETIDTRFGTVRLNREHPVIFPRGLLGLPNRLNYCLCEFPGEKLSRFKLLQSLDDMSLSFIALPVEINNAIFAMEDIITACDDLGIPVQDAALLLIVSVHRAATGVTLSVNARAPLLIDTRKGLAAQYVFTSDKYKVQHAIN